MLVPKIDYRIGGYPRYQFVEEDDNIMQVPDEVKKCVVFIGYNTNEGTHWGGTAFIVGIPVENVKDRYFNYFVTAKHSITYIKSKSIDGKVLVRLNSKNNSTITAITSINDWKFHPTEEDNVDVAVLSGSPPEECEHLAIPSDKMTMNEDVIKNHVVGEGDEVFITGLFKMHYGTQKNLPIIRSGNIALMPREKVYTKGFGYIDAYLVEGRSIGGLSGSPVFAYLGVVRQIDEQIKYSTAKYPIYYWLGLMHGHWDIPEEKIDVIMEDSEEGKNVNMGITIVVPASKVLEVINRDDFMEARKKEQEKMKKEITPTEDFAKVETTEKEFKNTLEKVSQKITHSEPDPSKPKT